MPCLAWSSTIICVDIHQLFTIEPSTFVCAMYRVRSSGNARRAAQPFRPSVRRGAVPAFSIARP